MEQPTLVFEGEENFVSPQAALNRQANKEHYENFLAPVYGPGDPLNIIKNPSLHPIAPSKFQPVPQVQASLPGGIAPQPKGGVVSGATYGSEVPGTYSGTSGGLKVLPSPSSLGPASSPGGAAITSNPNPVGVPTQPSAPTTSSTPSLSTSAQTSLPSPLGSALDSGLVSGGGGGMGAGSGTTPDSTTAPTAASKTFLQKYWWVIAAASALGIGIYLVKRK